MLSTPIAAVASGGGVIGVEYVGGASALVELVSRSPLKLIPAAVRGACVRVNAATFGGGLVAGDELSLALRVGRNARLHVGAAAPTKVYRSPAGRVSRSSVDARLAADALLVHTPAALTCFRDARYHQRQRFELETSASLALVEILTSGRSARGERWAFTEYQSRTELRVADRLVLRDALLLGPGSTSIGARMHRFDAYATVILVGPALRPLAAVFRRIINTLEVTKAAPFMASASPLGEGVIARIASESVEAVDLFLRAHLGDQLKLLTGQDPWRARW